MKILARNRKIFYTTYKMVFRTSDGDRIYSFPCNDFGEVDYDSMSPSQIELFEDCISAIISVKEPVVEHESKSFVASAIGVCDQCHDQVVIDAARNICSGCGAEYDYKGNSLSRLPLVG